jgi:ABC-type Fe3+ transport system substrate-binding protein
MVRLVGKGGFGAVYQANDTRLSSRVVAIKEMSDRHLSAAEKAQALQDFRNEADLLVPLQHLNLPNVSDFFEEAGKAYLVMEYIQGKTLEKEAEDAGGSLDEARVMGWALQLCDVLSYLHTRPPPIIFRDLKPTNIMVTPDDEIKLIDFGIARTFKATASKDTMSLGSQGYSPLEQYGRGQSDARSDIYALGATLYNLLTDKVPADAPTRRINPSAFQPPRQLNPRLTAATEHIILKAMAEEPKDRYQSAQEMHQAIVLAGVAPLTSVGMHTIVTPPAGKAAPTINALPPMQFPPPPAAGGMVGAATIVSLPGNAAPMVAPALVAYPGAAPTLPGGYPAGSPLPPSPGAPVPGQRRISRRRILTGGLITVGVLAAGGGAYFYFNRNPSTPGGASAGTITLTFTYSSEKEAWMKAATDAFHKSGARFNNKTIQVQLDERGSVDGHDRILSGEIKPVAWSPASFLELNQLSDDWQKVHSGQEVLITNGDLAPKALVFSPLVFAVWKERAQVLQAKYGKIDWPQIHSALTLKNGWQDIGGKPDWGLVKLGQTRPDQSNSGLLTIALLAYSYYAEQRGLTVAQIDAPDFLQYFREVEDGVTAFGRSSGTFLQNVVIGQGPAAYDVVTTYENLVLTQQQAAQQRQGQPLQLFYPSLNILSDHPFAILRGDWATQEEQMAAQVFRDFLLEDAQQRLALASGFRPTNPNVTITAQVPNNPFLGQSPNLQIKQQIQPLAQPPGGPMVNELIAKWKANYDGAPTTTGG